MVVQWCWEASGGGECLMHACILVGQGSKRDRAREKEKEGEREREGGRERGERERESMIWRKHPSLGAATNIVCKSARTLATYHCGMVSQDDLLDTCLRNLDQLSHLVHLLHRNLVHVEVPQGLLHQCLDTVLKILQMLKIGRLRRERKREGGRQ